MNLKLNADYWDTKTRVYLHDPFTKALRIQGHETQGAKLLEAIGLGKFDGEVYKAADQLASAMDRAQLPGYSKDPNVNGAIDFGEHPQLTHPTGSNPALKLELPQTLAKGDFKAIDALTDEVATFLNSPGSIGSMAEEGSLSDRFGDDPEGFAPVRFLYVHLLLRRELARNDIGGLGLLWPRLPADTRLPDHSVWQHNGLVSALHSCVNLSERKQASLLVYSLTPVQGFLNRARKLRDYWTGSVLLSWLAFCGIRAVIETLGPDHVLYPSLMDQPLVDEYLKQRFSDWPGFGSNKSLDAGIASFPNKFVCLVPTGQEAEIAETIKESIQQAWMALAEETLEMVMEVTGLDHDYPKALFERQCRNFWEFQWSASPLLGAADRETAEELLGPGSIQREWDSMELSCGFSRDVYGNPGSGESALYGSTHTLAQSALASVKPGRRVQREPEPGIKCDLYPEFEIITVEPKQNPDSRKDRFWKKLRERWHNKMDFRETERLCAISLIKRLAYQVARKVEDQSLQLLASVLKDDHFPSSTEMAAADLLDLTEACGLIQPGKERRKLAQALHDQKDETANQGCIELNLSQEELEEYEHDRGRWKQVLLRLKQEHSRPKTDADNYYAILLMDGDKMGDLVNGKTLGSTWESVIHPELVERIKQPGFDARYFNFWQKEGWDSRRRLAPAIHAAISEALGDFALYGISGIVNRHRGRLIYAGGDDLCAVLPVSEALSAAEEIYTLYRAGFVRYDEERNYEIAFGKVNAAGAKLAMHLGKGKKISISAGLLVCHHKKPLTTAVIDAQDLLKKGAKERGGRNAIAIKLDKRSGGGRTWVSKWDGPDSTLKEFCFVGDALGQDARDLSSSLAYRLELFRDGLEAIVRLSVDVEPRLSSFIQAQIDRSDLKTRVPTNELAPQVVRLIRSQTATPENLGSAARGGTPAPETLNLESLIVAKFLGERRWRREQDQEYRNQLPTPEAA